MATSHKQTGYPEKTRQMTLARLAEGVERFTIGNHPGFCAASERHDKTESVLNEAQTIQNRIATCRACPLAEQRTRVVVASRLRQKKFFILSDFPNAEEEKAEENIFLADSPIVSLLKGLEKKFGEIQQNTHFSFALKCNPEHSRLGAGSFFLPCAEKNLSIELATVAPEFVFCFGYQALLALWNLAPANLPQPNILSENREVSSIYFHSRRTRIFFVTGVRDLLSFPLWRKGVWQMFVDLLETLE